MQSTFKFKDIFKSSALFISYITDYDIKSSMTTEESNYASWLYKILYRQFALSPVQYSTIEAFKNHFANTLENVFDKYKVCKSLAAAAASLSNADLAVIQDSLANAANNPNTTITNPLEPIDYISAQTFNRISANKLTAYTQALRDMPDMRIETIIDEFKLHFKSLYDRDIAIYNTEEA